MLSLLEILQKTTAFFESRGIENPRLNAEHLIGHALGLKRMQLYLQFERLLPEAELEKIRPLVRRRAQREPLQYILGEVEFAGLRLKVDRRALIPRPETEYLIELLVARLSSSPATLIDLGTGSGAIALALANQYPEARATGVDASPDALALARENAALHQLDSRVSWLQSDWFTGVPAGSRFDLVVANPPYLAADEVAEAAAEVKEHEPHTALASSEDGLSDLRRIIADAPRFMSAGALLALETGIAHHAILVPLLQARGWSAIESVRDLTGRDRFIFARVA